MEDATTALVRMVQQRTDDDLMPTSSHFYFNIILVAAVYVSLKTFFGTNCYRFRFSFAHSFTPQLTLFKHLHASQDLHEFRLGLFPFRLKGCIVRVTSNDTSALQECVHRVHSRRRLQGCTSIGLDYLNAL
jgi:hypothetical protein